MTTIASTRLLLLLLLIFGVLYSHTDGRILPPMTTFSKELSFHDKRIILPESQNVVTDHESYLYAVCDNQKRENNCNVTIETPAFVNATYKDECEVRLVPDKPQLETIYKLQLHAAGDERALMSWLIKDHDFKTKFAKVRVIRMSDCKPVEISIPAVDIHKIVPYGTTFDVIINNKTFCGSDNCKLTYDVEGKPLTGPTQFLPKVKFSSIPVMIPASPESSAKGYFATLAIDNDPQRFHVQHVTPSGQGVDLAKTDSDIKVQMTNSYESFTFCIAKYRTNVTCRHYDAKMNLRINSVLEFHDEPRMGIPRWFQPHNLQDGGLLLLTGQITGKEIKKFESFSVIMIHPDGRRERPLEISHGLDLECTNAESFFVTVAENDVDEFCFHFVCNRQEFDDRYGIVDAVKFVTKCLPRSHAFLPKRRVSVVN